MIKFFRKIRQKLLTENKFSKYLIYAIGEIVLVVIGILIALSINNWNENRKSAEAELIALKELLIEFKLNHEDLSRVEDLKRKASNSLGDYIDFIMDKRIPLDDKNYTFSSRTGRNTWDPQYSVLNGLFNSGMINNLKNDSLRSELSYWQGYVKNYMRIQDGYVDLVLKHSDYKHKTMPRYINRLGEHNIHSKEKIEEFSKNVVKSLEYQNSLLQLYGDLNVQLSIIEWINEKYKRIVALLEEEIG